MDSKQEIRLPPEWKDHLIEEFKQSYMQDLKVFLKNQIQRRKCIYPPLKECFSAFYATPFDKVKVVILGQDPYHGSGQAHGLCFSVRPNVRIPPSLENIFKELKRDLSIIPPLHGCLNDWAAQGVLLLNATLTVEAGKAGSHQNKGWETFTDRVIHVLNEKREHLVFMLWGRYAQNKGHFIDQTKHLVLKAAHPSPFSASGFFGCSHFSKANTYLEKHRSSAIDWHISSSDLNASKS